MGRPSKDLHVVIGVLLLQQLHDLSDAETVEALAFNMAWHYALDVRSEADSYYGVALCLGRAQRSGQLFL